MHSRKRSEHDDEKVCGTAPYNFDGPAAARLAAMSANTLLAKAKQSEEEEEKRRRRRKRIKKEESRKKELRKKDKTMRNTAALPSPLSAFFCFLLFLLSQLVVFS